jgi:hypothetical protein
MQCNLSKKQKYARVVIGVSVLTLGAIQQSWWGLVGLIPIHTATVAWCPKGMFCAINSSKWWHTCCDDCC